MKIGDVVEVSLTGIITQVEPQRNENSCNIRVSREGLLDMWIRESDCVNRQINDAEIGRGASVCHH